MKYTKRTRSIEDRTISSNSSILENSLDIFRLTFETRIEKNKKKKETSILVLVSMISIPQLGGKINHGTVI